MIYLYRLGAGVENRARLASDVHASGPNAKNTRTFCAIRDLWALEYLRMLESSGLLRSLQPRGMLWIVLRALLRAPVKGTVCGRNNEATTSVLHYQPSRRRAQPFYVSLLQQRVARAVSLWELLGTARDLSMSSDVIGGIQRV